MENICSRHKLVGSHSIHIPSYGSPSQGDKENMLMQLPHDSPRLSRDALVLGPSAALNGDSTPNTSVNTLQAVPQHLNPHALCLGVDSSKNNWDSLWKWQRELLPFKDPQQELSTGQSGPYLKNGAERIRWTSHPL